MSSLLPQLEQMSFSPTGQSMCIYRDPASPHRMHLQCPYAQQQAFSPDEQAFNQSMSQIRMSQVRVSVEWVFGDVVTYFKFTDFKRNLKIGSSAVGQIYIVCAVLHNGRTCLYGNSTSTFSRVSTPAGKAGNAGKAGKWAFFRIWLEKLENHGVFPCVGWKSWNF